MYPNNRRRDSCHCSLPTAAGLFPSRRDRYPMFCLPLRHQANALPHAVTHNERDITLIPTIGGGCRYVVEHVLISRPRPTASGSPCFSVRQGCKIRYIFEPFFGIRNVSTRSFHLRQISVLGRATIVFASHRTVSGFFALTGRVQLAVPRAVGCFYPVRGVTLCVRGCVRCHGHGIFFNAAKGVSSLVPVVAGRGARHCLIPLDAIGGNSVTTVLGQLNIGRARYAVCDAIDGSFATRRGRTFGCSVLLFFSPANIGTLGTGFPSFIRNSVHVNTFKRTATGAIISRRLHLSFRTPAPVRPSVASTLTTCLSRRGDAI